ncbi:alpha-L-fucosidase [Chitinophaga ginsengisegetis]|uniref:alpha-L-fucosidase n=1 Tax=Chitinophaga ginsengisegetis TaxID=393003 RepID=UPI000DBA0262|nr:alpha-L-fucosidase [Chitinophaga ginsengisegetis]MDR6565091.1 alpha-L-fucosidase [Chitinophaga ginsengisegetis]MDR6644818.1 alpha-L-fucosidase [Chitinophaga ginsengisegetis]MDR6652590.1 alpha-L-fucosidase [Chitinophaga ginsengisegetis]
MKRRTLIKGIATGLSSLYLSDLYAHSLLASQPIPRMAPGPFLPTWDSLRQYQVPDWFRDAKFGIWAHWGPQCQPERGDWYARGMYQEGSDQYKYHLEKYGHPSKFGFKDVINEWKAENWNPEELVALYKKAGAKYFMAMANHHDNFDLFPSKYHNWNSTKLGPKKDIIGGWAKAAKEQDLPFGVTVHASHAWTWYEVAQRSDKSGPYAGVPYDGKLTKADGSNKWWNGYDPQQLYAQNHALSKDSLNDGSMGGYWDWGNGASIPDKAYCDSFLNRTIELINKYGPELVYFDDNVLPLLQVSDAGLKIAAHFYNTSVKKHGKLQAALFGKMLNEQQRKCMIWDIERGQSNQIEPLPWQTDTCIGGWHYDRRLFDNKGYKSAKTVVHTLADVVSKNGNLLLNVPVRGDGSIDSEERAVVEQVADWMKINSEAIYGTRPWKTFGEGPAIQSVVALSAQGFNEGKGKPFEAGDIRFTTKGKTLYAIVLGWPSDKVTLIKSLAQDNQAGNVSHVSMLGNDRLNFEQTSEGLKVQLPDQPPRKEAFVLKIEGAIV